MPQSESQQRASGRVAEWLARRGHSNTWLAEAAGIDPGTVGDFLNGDRWPKVTTRHKIEAALGWQSDSIRQIGLGRDPESVGAPLDDPASYVSAPGAMVEGSQLEHQILRELVAMRGEFDQLHASVRGLSQRVANLEQHGPESVDGSGG